MDSQPPKHISEPTAWSPALLGFYAGVGTASIGGAVAAVGWIVFAESENSTTVGVVGLLLIVAGFLGAPALIEGGSARGLVVRAAESQAPMRAPFRPGSRPKASTNRQIGLRFRASTEAESTDTWPLGFCDPNS